MQKRRAAKLYLIGIDAAPLWLLKENINSYRLGGFKKMALGNGVITNLESTMPPMTGPSWPSIYTGFRPGEHGVPEFLKMQPNYTKDVVFYNANIKRPFWDTLAEHGFKSLVITPPMVVKPSDEENVDMMTGFPLPPKFSSKKVHDAAAKHGFAGEPDIEHKIKSGEISMEKATKLYVESIERRSKMAKDLISGDGYDLAFVCFTEEDRAQHFSLNLPNWKDYVMPLYESISDFMLWIEERAEKEHATVMLVSDHGAQPIKMKFLLNGWLINSGYAVLKEELSKQIDETSAIGSMKYSMREGILKVINRSGSRKLIYDKLPKSLKGLSKAALSKLLVGASRDDYIRIHDFDYDMGRTKAFASVANTIVCTIFINDSRFEHGIVSKSEKPRLKKQIMGDLLKLKDERGHRLIVNVFDADDYYEGTKLFIAPDIMAEAKEGYLLDVFGYMKSGKLFTEPEPAKRGDHIRNGIFGILDYKNSHDYAALERKKLYVYNIEPTILKYFGIGPDNDKRYKSIV
ncbi:MAG: alkaline phosphatase family protein [Candidatus Micrarchaeaceae archaeon]